MKWERRHFWILTLQGFIFYREIRGQEDCSLFYLLKIF